MEPLNELQTVKLSIAAAEAVLQRIVDYFTIPSTDYDRKYIEGRKIETMDDMHALSGLIGCNPKVRIDVSDAATKPADPVTDADQETLHDKADKVPAPADLTSESLPVSPKCRCNCGLPGCASLPLCNP